MINNDEKIGQKTSMEHVQHELILTQRIKLERNALVRSSSVRIEWLWNHIRKLIEDENRNEFDSLRDLRPASYCSLTKATVQSSWCWLVIKNVREKKNWHRCLTFAALNGKKRGNVRFLFLDQHEIDFDFDPVITLKRKSWLKIDQIVVVAEMWIEEFIKLSDHFLQSLSIHRLLLKIDDQNEVGNY